MDQLITSKNIIICLTAILIGIKIKEITQSEHSYPKTYFSSRKERTNDLLKNPNGLNNSNNDYHTLLRIPYAITLREYFINKDDLLIHFRCWPTQSKPKAIVIISHGMLLLLLLKV